MKNKINLLCASLVFIAPCSLDAGIITGTNIQLSGPNDIIFLLDSIPATSGIATGGYFNSGFDVTTAVANSLISLDFTDLINNFNVLASGDLGGPDALGAGFFGNYFFADTYTPGAAAVPLNSVLYTFIGDGIDLGSSTYFALLESPEIVQADAPADDSNLLNPSTSTLLIGNADKILYDFGSGEVETASISLVGVPEPSTLLLSALGVLGLLRRKR